MEVVMPSNGVNGGPNLNNLPQWSRVGILDNGKFSKGPTSTTLVVADISSLAQSGFQGGSLASPADERVKHLEKSIIFLKTQQSETLNSLHKEIESLKQDNKNLQLQLSRTTAAHNEEATPISGAPSQARTELRNVTSAKVVSELRELKRQLEETKLRNSELQQKLIDSQEAASRAAAAVSSARSRAVATPYDMSQFSATTVTPLRVQFNQADAMHAPSSGEQSAIIKHLQLLNEQQSLELLRLRGDLKSLLQNTGEGAMYARGRAPANLGSAQLVTHSGVPLQKPAVCDINKAPEYGTREGIRLPSLKQAVSAKPLELRRKRVDVLHKARHQRHGDNDTQ